MPDAADIVARLDAIAALVAELRAAVAGAEAAEAKGLDNIYTPADDLAPEHLLEISTAVERFCRPADTLRYWCRREGCGVKVGGRWLASPARIKRKLGVE